MKAEAKTAQAAFAEVLEYYGESSRSMAPNTFFAIFVRFTKTYKVIMKCMCLLGCYIDLLQGENISSMIWESYNYVILFFDTFIIHIKFV